MISPDRQIWKLLGLRPDDRVLVAFVDRAADRVDMIPALAVSQDSGAAAALATWDHPDGSAHTRRIMDIARADGAEVRWWQVRAWCRSNGFNELGASFDGAADSIPMEMVQRAEQDGRHSLVRNARRGLWMDITGALTDGVEFHGSVPADFITPRSPEANEKEDGDHVDIQG